MASGVRGGLRQELLAGLRGSPARGVPAELDRTWPQRTRRSPKLTSSFFLLQSAITQSLVDVRDRYLHERVTIVDIGCGEMPYYPVFAAVASDYAGADLHPGPGIRYVGPAESLGAPDASFDVALSTQVLEHTRDPARCVAEMRRVLAPGGLALISTHGVWPYHPMPGDYWRWTHEGLRALVAGVGGLEILEILPHRASAACIANMAGYYVTLLGSGTALERPAAYFVALLNVAGILGDRALTRFAFPNEHALVMNYLVVARRVD